MTSISPSCTSPFISAATLRGWEDDSARSCRADERRTKRGKVPRSATISATQPERGRSIAPCPPLSARWLSAWRRSRIASSCRMPMSPIGLKTFSNHTTDTQRSPLHPSPAAIPTRTRPSSRFLSDGSVGLGKRCRGAQRHLRQPAAGVHRQSRRRPPLPAREGSVMTAHGSITCPPAPGSGIATVTSQSGWRQPDPGHASWPLYNLPPERGYPAQFGFKVHRNRYPTVLSAFPLPRTESYGLTVGTPNIPAVNVTAFTATFCGYGAETVAQ